MEQYFVMTAFGKDRPGIVADVSQIIFENGCNIEDSTMTLLSDEFTIMVLFSGQEKKLQDKLARDFRRLEIDKGISAFLKPVGDPRTFNRLPQTTTGHIDVEGLDQSGMVYKISQYLSENKINITNLTSHRKFSPESGSALYRMQIEVQIPEGQNQEEVKKDLIQIGDELNSEIKIY